MKKKVLAGVLALTMVAGMTGTAAETEHTKHGTAGTESESGAVVSTETEKVDDENKLSTQFYINVDKDATKGDTHTDITDDVPSNDDLIDHYELTWDLARKTNLSVTVPLYVCMYGYGGDGYVVTPKEDAYQISNESTYTSSETLTKIEPCYKVTVINRETTDAELKKIFGESVDIPDEQLSGEYGYYQTEKDGSCTVKPLTSFSKNSKGAYYCKTGTTVDSITEKDEDGNPYAIGTSKRNVKTNAPLGVKIPTIQASTTDWAILPMEDANNLKAGQIVMSIKGVDLSDALNGLDLGALDSWKVDAPIKNGKGDNATYTAATFKLPVKAQIAGGSLNEEGCVPVVKVTYTIAPDYPIPSDES